MPVRKISVALEDSVAAAAGVAAKGAGLSLSAWLTQAAENKLAIEAGLKAVSEWEAEHGEITDAEFAAAGALLRRRNHASRLAG